MGAVPLLDTYLAEHFPGLRLAPPLFYQAAVGLRFELGADLALQDGRMEQVYRRAQTLFEQAHAPHDTIFLVVDAAASVPPRAGQPPGFEVFHTYLREPRRLRDVSWVEMPYEYYYPDDEDDESDGWQTYRHWLRCRVADVRCSELLVAIANHEMGLTPRVADRCYFVNTARHTIFHLYDDRGLDIVAERPAPLEALYRRHGGWLLAHDRDRMAAVFGRDP
jgi:hypothetical protein